MPGLSGKYGKAFMNLGVAAVLVLLCIYVVPKVLLLFMPFLIGWFLAALANPAVHFLEEKLRVKRKAGSALVIILGIAGLGGLLYRLTDKLVGEVLGFLQSAPSLWNTAKIEFAAIAAKWSEVIEKLPEDVVEQAEELGGVIGREISVIVGELSAPTAEAFRDFTRNLPGIAIAGIMCLLSAYFFVAEKGQTASFFAKYVPEEWRQKCLLLKHTTMDAAISYVKAQFKIEIRVYLLMAAGLMLLKVKYSYFIAAGIALIDIIPVFGTGIVLLPWAVMKALAGEYAFALGLLVIWGASQLVRQLIQPKIVGDCMGMAPIPSLILLYIGYKYAGVIGMIAAVPLGIIVLNMNEAGFFDTLKKSLKIIWDGFHRFRKL